MKHLFLAAPLILAAAVSAQAATFTIFDDQDAFAAQASNVTPVELSADSSVLTITGADVRFNDGVLRDRINLNDAPDTVFTFNQAVLGFGGLFDLSPFGAGAGISLTVTVGDASFALAETIAPETAGSFFGFLSDTAFTSFSLSEGTGGLPVETYELSNVVSAPAPIPLPASLPLLAAALGAFAVLHRRQGRA
ncbi:VPLPA-CTERM sorting domain-containing protein [Epibacterium sp. SM1979]|uniref:VPLPA-CTERM sorting domain-containing protein n=1 Tax=Tritonibacter litoralis TaxID=2662264 RepID=A0A843YMJ2_9RHOB|nr:VPLPA-CTERM sorting domain-containing protein [Tritonibacter litoralis]MQQ10439.1 VPLPA-CTERM sorting domain-containing protein [Tritonibacter litoralis]